ncbi:HAD-IA family hydrolase [Methylotenera sp.]|uniref:HAD-IA family hydrolase n=2 Tax=Methylotenera sp. TaxID=2051956 RepID=UPI00271F1939|nr:HAD-IA family hydrolase [Methylotenera sp.]MDO9204455.1 HAD-IA family hydrolase [Methylotenera sp.]MDP1521940.1 HAD-IA family hydrolase [Methylotenera sp.]MDP2072160.1 HAD-IA family hydrolase [Methylotenera sp.]MDP3006829.1 HAD-IA family hydrolase [Methylotenera sp.]MDP3007234.1 HAD-IA family hydrolase [Methylotenera sp.]
MRKQFDLIVWDWDGTLADSTGMITNAILKAAEQVGLPVLTPQAASNIIGLGLRESIEALYGEIPVEQAQALATQYTANYYAGEREIPLFEGVADTMATLNKRGFKLAVATGKGRRGLNLALEHSGLGKYFHSTRTVDECFSKPHPQMLDELMEYLVVLPERTLMIGDTSYDLHMAQNAGVSAVGVTFGAQQAEQWQHLNPIQQFDDFTSLSQWLLEHA